MGFLMFFRYIVINYIGVCMSKTDKLISFLVLIMVGVVLFLLLLPDNKLNKQVSDNKNKITKLESELKNLVKNSNNHLTKDQIELKFLKFKDLLLDAVAKDSVKNTKAMETTEQFLLDKLIKMEKKLQEQNDAITKLILKQQECCKKKK